MKIMFCSPIEIEKLPTEIYLQKIIVIVVLFWFPEQSDVFVLLENIKIYSLQAPIPFAGKGAKS